MKTKDYLNKPHVKEEIRSRFNYDPETGQLTWATRDETTKRNVYFNENFAGKPVGKVYESPSYGYLGVFVKFELFGKRVNLVAARICWLVMIGDWPKHTIDHIDRDGTNNKWENLRDVTQGENNKNKGPYKKRNHC